MSEIRFKTNNEEEAKIKVIMKVLKIPTKSQVVRTLITEKYQECLKLEQ